MVGVVIILGPSPGELGEVGQKKEAMGVGGAWHSRLGGKEL